VKRIGKERRWERIEIWNVSMREVCKKQKAEIKDNVEIRQSSVGQTLSVVSFYASF